MMKLGRLQQGREAVHDPLVTRGARVVLGVKARDRLHRIIDGDRRRQGRLFPVHSRYPRRGAWENESLSTHEPKHDEHDQDRSQNAPEAGHAVVAVSVITAAAAENKH